jgi:ABC-type lipoprotein export system ATPase subunit
MSLELKAITHRYSACSPPVLRDVTFSFPSGGSVAVIGPSGSGKTTLLSIIGLLARPSAGQVTVDGKEVSAAGVRAPEIRGRLFAWVFQTVNVLGARNAVDNAMLGLLAQGTPEREAGLRRVLRWAP